MCKKISVEEFMKCRPVINYGFLTYDIEYKNCTFSAMVKYSIHNPNEYHYQIWGDQNNSIIVFTSLNVDKEDIIKRLDSFVKGDICCSICGKPLFNYKTKEKYCKYNQVWAGFYCEEHNTKEVMDTKDLTSYKNLNN